MENILEIKNLSISYEDKKILKGININIKKNKITSIIGPSGCGKTTFLKTLNSIINEEGNPEIEGEIFFKGKNIKDIDEENLRKI